MPSHTGTKALAILLRWVHLLAGITGGGKYERGQEGARAAPWAIDARANNDRDSPLLLLGFTLSVKKSLNVF